MTILQPAANLWQQGPCPGPIPTSAAHAERCRSCGKCAAIASLLNAPRSGGRLMETAQGSSPARLQS